MLNLCPACEKSPVTVFYSVENIPVHSVRLLWSREDALKFSTGKMDLAHCPECGFICNVSYQPELQDYSAEYESTQAYSPTFNAFAQRLAQNLIDRYNLRGKQIVEIGCGQGEFLSLLCELGSNRGIGFDPAYDPIRSVVTLPESVDIIPDYYSEKYTSVAADFVCCKMTLEHIQDVANFIGVVRRSIGNRPDTTVFFQVPDVNRVLQEVAFWDIYYEHCSYFSLGSIARLFRSQGFDVRALWRDYGDQYLMIDALPASGPTQPALPEEDDLETVARDVAGFTARIPTLLSGWKDTVREAVDRGEKVVLWGGGSKGVAFLTTLDICDEILYAVDINPNKNNTFMAGTGQRVVSPQFMAEYHPDLVVLMNPLYRQEVQAELAKMGLTPCIIGVGE
jgi:SAM-dependent methyltransferase